MHILQLCKKFPYPLKDGEAIAVTYLSRAFNALGCKVSLLAMNTSKHFTDVNSIPESFSHYKEIRCTYLDNEVTGIGAFKNLFSSKSFHLTRFYSKEFEDELISMLKANTYDIIQIESLYLAQYIDVIRAHSKGLVVMRAHNVEHEIWDRITMNTQSLPKRLYLKYLTRKLKVAEREYLQDYDYLVAISARDLKQFRTMGYKNGATVAPIGIKIEDYKPLGYQQYNMEMNPCFIGSLDWIPNIEGLEWFLDKVWPDVAKENKDLFFHIAGRNAIKPVNYQRENTVFHGEVDCARSWLSNYNIMIVPLLSGSGMRAKIIEAMALGMVVITTTIGLEGIPAEDGEHILIADNPEDFNRVFTYLRNHPEQIGRIGKNARNYAETNYNNILIASRLLDNYREYLGINDTEPKGKEKRGEIDYSVSL